MPTSVERPAPISRMRLGILRAAPKAGIDRAKGVIAGFAVITRGEALGHECWIDAETLAQVAKLGNAKGNGLKSRFTHPGLCSDGLGKYLGRARGFTVEGDLVRGDLTMAGVADKSPDGKLGSYVLDLAEEDPASFGSSIVFQEDPDSMEEFVEEHGGEFYYNEMGYRCLRGFKSPDPQNARNLPHLRIKHLFAVDIVDDPAANPDGIFGNASEITGRAEQVLSWLCGISDAAPGEFALGGIEAPRAKEFFEGFLGRHGLTIGKKGNIMPKVMYEAKCKHCKKTHALGIEAGKGQFDAHEVECPYCNKKFDFAPPAADDKPKDQASDEPAEKPKDEKPAMGVVTQGVAFATFKTEDEIRAEEAEKARKYGADFDGAMTAAGIPAAGRETFRTKYFGKAIADVREFASLWCGQRTQPVGENGAGVVGAEGKKGQPSPEALAPFVERFKTNKGTRRAFRCYSDDPESEEYKKALERYLKSVKTDPSFLPKKEMPL